MPVYAAYVRVSSDLQKERQTIQNQLAALKSYASANKITIKHIFADDGVSGTIPITQRSDGRRLIEEASRRTFDTLLLFRIDRLSRDTLDLLKTVKQLEEYGVSVRSITEPFETSSPVGKFTLTMVSSMAQMEKDTIRDRSRLGMKRGAESGRWMGGRAPFGYQILNGRLEIKETEALIVREIFLAYATGNTTQSIADSMNARNVPIPAAWRFSFMQHAQWRDSTVQKLLHNELYRGTFQWNKSQTVRVEGKRIGQTSSPDSERIATTVPSIVTVNIFNKVQDRLKANLKFSSRNAKREYPLRGLVFCGVCGLTCSGTGGIESPAYVCNNRRAGLECDRPRMGAIALEEAVWGELVELSAHPESLLHSLRAQRKERQGAGAIKTRLALINEALAIKVEARRHVLSLLRKGTLSGDEAEDELKIIEKEQSTLNSEREKLKDTARQADEFEESLQTITTALKRIKRGAKRASEKDKGELARTIVRRITLDKENAVEIDFLLPPLA